MRYSWTEEQNILRTTLHKYIADRFNFDDRRRKRGKGLDDVLWTEFAEMGLLGLPFAEEYGGSGGTAIDTFVVMEAFGRGLATEPYIPTVVLGGGLLQTAGSEQQKSTYLPAIAAGEVRFALGYAESQSRFNLAKVETTAVKGDRDYRLNGSKSVVLGAPDAHMLLITARTAGKATDEHGISLFLVPCGADGIRMRCYTNLDGSSAAEVTLTDVRVPMENLVGELHAAFPVVERVIDEGISAISAEAVGIMAALNEKCVSYAKVREAFGKPIADFQVIGHRLVDMEVAYEQAFAIAIKAAQGISTNAPELCRTISACKYQVNQEAATVGKHAVQLHGAIGITEELDIGHYFKRIMAIQATFGNADYHLQRFVRLGNANQPA